MIKKTVEPSNGQIFRHVPTGHFWKGTVDGAIQRDIYQDQSAYEILPGWIVRNSKDWEEIKVKPLFKTEDGVDIYEGDKIWRINGVFEVLTPIIAQAMHKEWGEQWFSTKKAAEEYIFFNKPFLSVKECINWLGDSMAGTYDSKRKLIARYPVFVQRVESKLKK